ncbi:MAG TPA: thiamine pyrophosphate-binding protein [Conexibacter sp.]|jgi:acetolactate synthase-1/2/3 large subunit|nr:thiamine pyrophosphate-binding protein [Conexibacter sp.]
MQVVEAIAAAIKAEGVTTAFCVPDEVTIHVGEALRQAGVRVVRSRHEQNAVAMADGYARGCGRPAICSVGHGPALAQVGTALMTAVRRRSPVLVLSPQGERARGNVKEFDARRFAENCGARYVEMRGRSFVAEDVHEGFRLALLRKGPVVLGIPRLAEINAEIPGQWEYEPALDVSSVRVVPDPACDAIDELAGALAWARKPVIVAGRGAVASGAGRQIEALADRVGALLATSLQGRELFRDHPRNIGMIGSYGSEAGVELLAEADCILAVGVALNFYQTGGGTLAANARVLQIDDDPERIGSIARVASAVIADARTAVEAINAALEAAEIVNESAWTSDAMRERIAAAARRTPPGEPDLDEHGRLPMTPILSALDALLPAERVVIADAGDFVLYTIDQIAVPDPTSWVWTADFGSIGMGLGIGLGMALARPDRHCVLFAGDGGFAMSLQELETAARERLPLTMVVLDDRAYRPEARYMQALGKPADMAFFDEVDFAAVARAFGIPAVTVRALADLDPVAELIANREGPILIDAKVSGTEQHRSSAAYEKGTMIPKLAADAAT